MKTNYTDVTLELTYNCNFKCTHCYNSFCISDRRYLEYENVVDIEEKIRALDIVKIYLTGGEPLIHPSFKQIYVYLYSKGYKIAIASNGSLIDSELIDIFKVYPPHNINISLYGYNESTYEQVTRRSAFKKVLFNINELKRSNIEFFVKYVALKQNACGDEVCRILTDINVPCSIYYNMMPCRDSLDDNHEIQIQGALLDDMILCQSRFKQYASLFVDPDIHLDHSNCQVWAKSFVVSPTCHVRPCIPSYSDNSFNILENEIHDLPYYLKMIHEKEFSHPDHCVNCDIKSYCKCPMILRKYKTLENVCKRTQHKIDARIKLQFQASSMR